MTAVLDLPVQNVETILDRVASDAGYGEGGNGLPNRRRLLEWREESPEFARLFTRARASRGDAVADRAGRWLLECDPEKGDARTASARVSLAQYRAAHDRWLAGCLDRDTYGDALKVDGKLQIQAVVAFVDVTRIVSDAVDAEPLSRPPGQPSAYDHDRKG